MLSVTTKSGIYNSYKVIGTQTLGLRGLVLWLKFNEGSGNIAYDSSFYNNHGTIYGATWTDGKFGKALSFDGVDDYVDCGNAINPYLTGDLTIGIWLYPKAFGKNRGIAQTKYKYEFAFTITDSEGRIRWFQGDGSNYDNPATNNPILSLNQWQHLVAVRDMDAMKVHIYLNGQFKESLTITTTPAQSNYHLHIGEYSYSDRWFNGLIDEVRIYNRALSENEIKMLYYNRIGAVPSKTI